MSDYKETAITGSSYVRANTVLLENPKNGTPAIIFTEERWYDLGEGTTVAAQLGQFKVNFEPAGVIDILDPGTGAPTGQTITQAEVYAAIYSFYIQAALDRDAVNSQNSSSFKNWNTTL